MKYGATPLIRMLGAEAAYQRHDALWALRAGRRTWAEFARPGGVLRQVRRSTHPSDVRR